MTNNFPIKYIEKLFNTYSDDIDLKFHFLVIIMKKGSSLSTTSHFLVIPKQLYISQIKSKIWSALCDKLLYIYIKKIFNINLGLILVLVTYYIVNMIFLKINFQKNHIKFYTKEERLESIGNYLIFNTLNFSEYCKNNIKSLRNENFFSNQLISEHYLTTKDLSFYKEIINSTKLNNEFSLFNLIFDENG